MKPKLTPRQVFWLGIALWLLALPFPFCVTINQERQFYNQIPGVAALAYGLIGLYVGNFAWLANPLILMAGVWMRNGKWVWALRASSIAVGCSLMTFRWFKPFPTILLMVEPTPGYTEDVLFVGGWLWLAAIACVWWSSYLGWRDHASAQQSEPAAENTQPPVSSV